MIAPSHGMSPTSEGMGDALRHVTVLKTETVRLLNVLPDGLYVDATLGGGGHSEEILELLNDSGRLVGIDRDAGALARAKKRLERFGSRFETRHGNFANLADVLRSEERGQVCGIVADLGVSSFQIDEAERGFSFQRSGPLDMRMDREESLQLADLLEKTGAKELGTSIGKLGEERFARRIAEAIKREWSQGRIASTEDLAQVVASAVPRKFWPKKIHVATKTFMALRMLVNCELENLERFLSSALDVLAPDGRLAVISFHSLEDRMVRNAIKEWTRRQDGPPGLPVPGYDREALVEVLTPKPVTPTSEEVDENPRSRSAKLRAVRKR